MRHGLRKARGAEQRKGAALNEGRELFPSDEKFGDWLVSSNLRLSDNDKMERAAAMWAAGFPDEFAEAQSLGGARTVRGIHSKWLDLKAEREAEAAKAEAERLRLESLELKKQAAERADAEAKALRLEREAKNEADRLAAKEAHEKSAAEAAEHKKAAEAAELAAYEAEVKSAKASTKRKKKPAVREPEPYIPHPDLLRDLEFGRWIKANALGQLAQEEVEPKVQQAAMWAAGFPDELHNRGAISGHVKAHYITPLARQTPATRETNPHNNPLRGALNPLHPTWHPERHPDSGCAARRVRTI